MSALSRRLLGLVAAAGLALVAACNMDFENMDAPGLAKDKDIAAREVYAKFRDDVNSIRPRFGPEMQGPEAEAAIPQIVALIPKGAPTKTRLASWRSNTSLGSPSLESLVTTHEYTYPDVVVDAETVMSRPAGSRGAWTINGFHIKRRAPGTTATPAPASAQSEPATAPAAPPAQPATNTNEFITPEQAAAEEARENRPLSEGESGGGSDR